MEEADRSHFLPLVIFAHSVSHLLGSLLSDDLVGSILLSQLSSILD